MNSEKCFRCAVTLGLVACTCVFSFNYANFSYNTNLNNRENESIPQIPEMFPSIVQSMGSSATASAMPFIEFKTNPVADSQFYDFNFNSGYKMTFPRDPEDVL